MVYILAGMSGFFTELRRRNVFRVAAAYAVIAWILVEVLSTVLPMFGVPEWVLRVLVILLVAGFVPAVIFAWAFEITPEGIKREHEVDRTQSITDQTAKKLDVVVIILLVVGIGVFTVDRFVLSPRVADAPEVLSIDRIDSIAVLPFEDFSAGGDQAYLGTGIADTILHSLAQIQGLKVAARTSSFQLHAQDADIPTIGRTLGVGAVLEGSVQTSGNRLRIIAQLIRTSDQSHLWSQTFESTTDDIFATQDTIAAAVAATLRGKGGSKPVAQERTTAEVFELVAKGRHLWQQRNPDDTAEAVCSLQRAVMLDPEYAQAWSELGAATWFNHLYGQAERADARTAALAAADRALALDDTLAQPWGVRGLIAGNDGDLPGSIDGHRRAVELNPNYSNAMAWLSQSLRTAGLLTEGAAMIERAYQLDPMATYVRGAYARALITRDDPTAHRRAVEVVEESLRLTPGAFRALTDAVDVHAAVGDLIKGLGYAIEGLRQRPNSETMQYSLIQALFQLGEAEAVEKWGARVDATATIPGFWRFAARDWAGWAESQRVIAEAQPDNGFAVWNYSFGLILAGDYTESRVQSERALTLVRANRYRDVPLATELSLMHQLIWLYGNAGEQKRADELRLGIVPLLETLKRNGLPGDFFTQMMLIDQGILLGDYDRALAEMRGVGTNNQKHFVRLWRDMPWYGKLLERSDVQALLEEWDREQAALRARLRAEGPAAALDPALL